MPETCAAIVIAAKHGELIKVRDYSGITDTVGALRCKFEFRTNDWDNATMTAVFCKGNMATNPEIVDGAIGVLLDSIDECAVPAEVLTRDAKYFSVGVWGVTAAGFRIVSKWLVFRIEDGCYVDATEPIEPTPTVYEQIMSALSLKAPINHEHNDIYYTKPEFDELINNVKPNIDPKFIEAIELNTEARHKHKGNLDILDKFSEDENGTLLYDGSGIKGIGLTDEQVEDLNANTEARHTHENKYLLDSLTTDVSSGRLMYGSNILAKTTDLPSAMIDTEISNALNGGVVLGKKYLGASKLKYYTEKIIRDYIDPKISTIPKFAIEVVETLPTENISNTTVYLLNNTGTGHNLYTEFIYVNGSWECLGSQQIDLSNYRTKDESVPASEVSYTHPGLADKSGTAQGALDEAVNYVISMEGVFVKRDNISTEIEAALETAKESGEFDGNDGLSAYQIWLKAGNTGTEEDFLASLKGEDGIIGKDGYTPQKGIDYFDGEKGDPFTYEDFTPEQLEALKGADGKTPVKGTDYFTEADKSELVNSVLAALPKAEEDEF